MYLKSVLLGTVLDLFLQGILSLSLYNSISLLLFELWNCSGAVRHQFTVPIYMNWAGKVDNAHVKLLKGVFALVSECLW